LLELARKAGVAHFLYISIVGIDRIPSYPYYRVKLAAEVAVEQGSVPWSIFRATQFHTLIDRLLRLPAWAPVAFLPTDFHFQPVDGGEVADRMVEIVAAGPSGRVLDMGGPQVQTLGELANEWRRARGLQRWILPLPLPGKTANAFRRGYNTCPENRQGRITWED